MYMVCSLCGKLSDTLVCRNCYEALYHGSFAYCYAERCPLCGTPLLDSHYPCARCTDRILAFGRYEEPLSRLIIQYKITGERKLKSLLASLYLTLLSTIEHPVLIPVPASREGFDDRGFDQMLLIVKVLRKKVHIPFLTLFKPIGKIEQKFLSSEERKKSVSYSLETNKTKKVQNFKKYGYEFVLLDDISTTGSTLAACRKLLLDTYGIKTYGVVLALA